MPPPPQSQPHPQIAQCGPEALSMQTHGSIWAEEVSILLLAFGYRPTVLFPAPTCTYIVR